MTPLIVAAIVVAVLVVLWFVGRERLTGARTRIFRGVGVANDADERTLGAGIITSQPIFDLTHTYFDGRDMVSCDECPNPVLCQGCPNVAATAAEIAQMQKDEPRGRVGAGRSPIIGTSTRVRDAALERYAADDANPLRHLRKCGTHTPGTAAGLLGPRSTPQPVEYVGLNNYQYIHRLPYI